MNQFKHRSRFAWFALLLVPGACFTRQPSTTALLARRSPPRTSKPSPRSGLPTTTRHARLASRLDSAASADVAAADWSPGSWRSMPSQEGVTKYSDAAALATVEEELAGVSPLVFAGEVRALQAQLAKATMGQGFVLFGGDCGEAYAVDRVRDTFRVVLQMALIMTYGGAMPVTKVGRMAGQYTAAAMNIGAADAPDDPTLMLEHYFQDAQTLNILRAFSTGGFADISRLHAWNLDFVESSPPSSKYRQLASKVDEALRFMTAIGVDVTAPTFTECDFFTAHECLSLQYEEALTRTDSITGKDYDCSTHLLWVGSDRAKRNKDGAHIEFCRGVNNPVGVEVTAAWSAEELVEAVERLNPSNVPGRVVVIVRMGADQVREKLPALVRGVLKTGKNVLWVSDPVRGNVVKSGKDGQEDTIEFEAIRAELRAFFDVHEDLGTHVGGLHLEMTGDDVSECLGGVSEVTEEKAAKASQSTAAAEQEGPEMRIRVPRLNGEQAIELAFLVGERMRKRMALPPLSVQ